VKDFDFEGKEALWEIFACVKDTKVLDSVSNLLVTLYTSFVQTLNAKAQ
jgi:ubiquitin carboxyl-terminal hydrolase 9/24